MKELIRDADPTRINYYRTILEAEEIEVFVRNESVGESGPSPIPLSETFPALCVVNDADYSRAMQLLELRIKEDSEGSEKEIPCPKCGSLNPGNFTECWSCGAPLKGA